MHSSIIVAASLASAAAAETVIGAYIFSRHGDRTAKSTPPTVLTDLGYQEVSKHSPINKAASWLTLTSTDLHFGFLLP
jgi:hypothetical protein